jgi:hypothetical protein
MMYNISVFIVFANRINCYISQMLNLLKQPEIQDADGIQEPLKPEDHKVWLGG